jgi:hypothetical protein
MVKSSKPASTTSTTSTSKKKDVKARGLSINEHKDLIKKRKHEIKIVKDKDQCTYALGDIPCDGKINCYLCDTYLIPHFSTYINCVKKTDNIWKKFNYESKDGFYPQCEHIIPCASILTPKPWFMNIMLYSLHNTMFKKYNIKKVIDVSTITSHTLSTSALTPDQKKLYFLKIIVRMNYAWAHSICNNTKNDFDFIEFKSTTGYQLFKHNIDYVINTIFSKEKYDKYIRNELRYKRKFLIALPDTITSKANSTISTENRLNFILYHLNNGHKFLGTPISEYVATGGSRKKRILGGTPNKDLLLSALRDFINKTTSNDLIEKINLTIELITKIEETDIFFVDCIRYIDIFNINDVENINDFNEYLQKYLPDNIDKYEKNIDLFNHIKKIELHPTYKLLEQFLLYILNNDDKFILNKRNYKNADGITDNDKIKSDYIKFFDFNSNENTVYLGEIFKQTDPRTRFIIVLLINHFKQIFMEKIDNDEKKFYEICHIYFILDISYGLLYKDKSISSRLEAIREASTRKALLIKEEERRLSIIEEEEERRLSIIEEQEEEERRLSSPIKKKERRLSIIEEERRLSSPIKKESKLSSSPIKKEKKFNSI